MTINNQEVSYGLTGDRSRGVVHSYHGKPYARDMKKGGKKDIQGLPKKVQSVLINSDGDSRYSIGFEVEKNELHRRSVREYELFCGFERDGSCGYEAVTNILPLLPPSKWRMKVYDMMVKADRIIEDTYSPSDSKCGGHITVAVDGLDGEQLLAKMRPYAGIIYAIFWNRLKNYYCRYNPTLLPCDDNDNWVDVGYLNGCFGKYHSKYRIVLPKYDILEWRVPSRFTSVKQMMRRYELFYEVVDASVNGDGSERSFNALVKKVKPILVSMYDKDMEKVEKRIKMASQYREYILSNGKVVGSLIDGTVYKNENDD